MVLTSIEKTYRRGAPGYEEARRATVWNGLLPDRFPDVIVQAHDTDDVVAALRYARDNGHKVGVRSGGHSWAASHLRDGGLLLDVSRLDHCTVDTAADDCGRRAGQDRQRLRDRTRLARALLPFGSLRGHSPRRLSSAGWIRLEQSGDRPGMRERARARGRHRRRRTDLLRPREPPRHVLGRPRRGTGFLRCGHVLQTADSPAAGGGGHLPVHVPDRVRRRGITPGDAKSVPRSTSGSSSKSSPRAPIR